MSALATAGLTVAGATTGAVVFAAASPLGGGPDMWTILEKGGPFLSAILFLALIEVVRRHDKAHKIIEAKDATILEMSARQTKAMETTSEIADDQMKIARDTHALIKDLVTLLRGKLDIG